MALNARGRIPNRLLAPGLAERVVFTVGAEAVDVIKVTLQLKGPKKKNLGVRAALFAYLSDDAFGDSIAASAPSGGWAIATNGLLIPVVANKAAHLVSEANGLIDVNVTETSAKSFWVVVVLADGSLVTQKITFA